MTYQQVNQQKQMAKSLAIKTVSYDENGIYIRHKNWNGMNWIGKSKRLSIYLRDNLQCQYCGKSLLEGIKLTLDHVTPISLYNGSPTDVNNLVTCCTNCNYRKQDLTLNTFAKVLADSLNIDSAVIIIKVKNALRRKVKTAEAYQIIKAQKNWNNTYIHLKNKVTL